MPDLKYIPIVAFSSNCTLKVKVFSTVIYSNRILREIKKYEDKVIEHEEILNIYNKLLGFAITDKEQKKEHVKRIKSSVYQKDLKIDNNFCPKCGGRLIERKGKTGKFKGCSNYPKCRFTASM